MLRKLICILALAILGGCVVVPVPVPVYGPGHHGYGHDHDGGPYGH